MASWSNWEGLPNGNWDNGFPPTRGVPCQAKWKSIYLHPAKRLRNPICQGRGRVFARRTRYPSLPGSLKIDESWGRGAQPWTREYPCGKCSRNTENSWAIQCDWCGIWFHEKCAGLQKGALKKNRTETAWRCDDCKMLTAPRDFFPCGICRNHVGYTGWPIPCKKCEKWVHQRCSKSKKWT